MLTSLLSDITGNNILQAFTTKNFAFLDEKHPSIRSNLKKLIEEHGEKEVEDEIVDNLALFVTPWPG